MCLRIQVVNEKEGRELAKNPKVATKNIVVYKRLMSNGRSPYRLFMYKRGIHYYQTSKKKLTGKFIHSFFYPYDYFEVSTGLHAYRTIRAAKHNKKLSEMIVRMIIPKGALYYNNETHIVSSELIFPYSDEEVKIYLTENKQNKNGTIKQKTTGTV